MAIIKIKGQTPAIFKDETCSQCNHDPPIMTKEKMLHALTKAVDVRASLTHDRTSATTLPFNRKVAHPLSNHHQDYHTRDQARAEIFDYLELFYNRKRIHQSLNYQSPMTYESIKLLPN